MGMKFKKQAIAIKIESVYGTDAVPTKAANAMMVEEIRITPMKLVSKERGIVMPFFGNQGKLVAGQYMMLEADIAMTGSGTAGTAPGYGVCFKACGMSETIVAVTSVAYTPIDVAEQSVDVYWWMGGVLHKMTGVKGDVSWKMPKDEKPVWTFSFIGLYNAPADVALPTDPTLTAFKKPIMVNNANTVASLHSYAGVFHNISGKLGNAIAYRNAPGIEEIVYTDRQGSAQFELDAVLVATKDWFTIAKGETLGAFTVTHGITAGYKVKIDHANVQIGASQEPKYDNKDGIATVGFGADLLVSSAGFDDTIITFI